MRVLAFLLVTLSLSILVGCNSSDVTDDKEGPPSSGGLGAEYIEEPERDRGFESGFDEGFSQGSDEGYDEGYEQGYEEGLLEGFDEGCIALGDRLIQIGALTWYECPSY